MVPKVQGNPIPQKVWIGGVGLLLAGAITVVSIPPSALAELKENNLINLVHNLSGTTSEMLANTSLLQHQVSDVEQKLGQLNQQEAVLRQQTQTGKALNEQLVRQEDLTANGVRLMGEILKREQVSVQVTGDVTSMTQKLTGTVSQNAQLLTSLASTLGTAQQQSVALNSKMDQLLAELDKSRQNFRFFGKIKQLVPFTNPLSGQHSNPLPGLSLPGTRSTSSSSSPLSPLSPSTPANGPSSGTTTNPLQGLLNNLP